MSTSERRAYRNAWRARRRTGDVSAWVLISELHAQNADPTWTNSDSDLHSWLMDCWRRGIPPRRLSVEAIKKGATLVPPIARGHRELFRYFR